MKKTQNLIRLALAEDIGTGDITTSSIIPDRLRSKAKIIAKESGIVCGIDIADQVFRSVNRKIRLVKKVKDGAKVIKGTVLAIIGGPTRGILTAERTALNFIQKLSGVATLTAKFV